MKPKVLISLSLICFMMATGCAAILAGSAAGVGVYSYVNGELKRSYPEAFDKTIQICLDTLTSLKISVQEKSSDGITARISAKRMDDTPVTLKVTMIAPKITEVSVRSGVVGIWDKNVSELIHASIAQRL